MLLSTVLSATLACGPGADPVPANPLAGSVLWVDPESAAALAEQQLRRDGDPTTADGLTPISSQPVATWLVNDDPVALTERVTQTAAVTRQLPVLVLYHRPGRDCGSYSGGGAAEQSSYLTWVGAVADAIGDQRALVVVEPDAIPQALSGQCAQDGNPASTYAMLASAVQLLAAHENTLVYLDAGHPGWIADAAALAGALRDSGAAQADGFSLNVSNFATTADNQTYGDSVSRPWTASSTSSTSPATDAALRMPTRRASTPGATHQVSHWARTPGSGPTARSPWARCGSRSPAPRTGTAARVNPRPGSSGPTTPSA